MPTTIIGPPSPDLDAALAISLAQTFLVAPGERPILRFLRALEPSETQVPRILVGTTDTTFDTLETDLPPPTTASERMAEFIRQSGPRTPFRSFELDDASDLLAYVAAHAATGDAVSRLITQAGGDTSSPAASTIRQLGLDRLLAGMRLTAQAQCLAGERDEYVVTAFGAIVWSICFSRRYGHTGCLPSLTPSLAAFNDAGDRTLRTLIAQTGANPDHPAAQTLHAVGPHAWTWSPHSTLTAALALAEIDVAGACSTDR